MSPIKLNKRIWLLRITTSFAVLFLVSFLFILFRGMAWSPHGIDEDISKLELGITTMIRYSGQRSWVTRLDQQQRQKLQKNNQFVHAEGGCEIKQPLCFIKAETTKQGVLFVYVNTKPDILPIETVWLGWFINPNNGAVYDLLGRLYRGSVKENDDQIERYINIPE